ncbi:unnamed protein product [Calypogeia fissa]
MNEETHPGGKGSESVVIRETTALQGTPAAFGDPVLRCFGEIIVLCCALREGRVAREVTSEGEEGGGGGEKRSQRGNEDIGGRKERDDFRGRRLRGGGEEEEEQKRKKLRRRIGETPGERGREWAESISRKTIREVKTSQGDSRGTRRRGCYVEWKTFWRRRKERK